MNLWFVLAGLIIFAVAGGIIACKTDYEFSGGLASALSGVATIVVLVACILQSVSVPKEIAQFNRQKQYIESHVVADSIENAALTSKKIELNDWLYSSQYKNANWGNWSFYPDSIQELTPIQ
ncbi:MAG: hypothetical protein WC373_13800 [Smithella sp.]|jgi:hypothetical protein